MTPPSSPTPPAGRRWFPLAVLQVVELVVAFVLVDTAVHVVRGGGVLAGAAAGLAVLALTARGPLGVVRVVPTAVHVHVVTVAAVVLALAPLVPALRPDIEGIIVVEVAAIGLLRVATLTRTTPAGSGPPGSRWFSGRNGNLAAGTVIDGTVVDASTRAPVAEPPAPHAPVAPDATAPATATTATGPGWARTLGRAAGAAGARYGPEVKARTRASLRQAGHTAGRLRSAAGDDPSGPDPASPEPPGDRG